MYSKAFRTLMVQKMCDPHRTDAQSLADEIGVSRSTLYRWVSEADSFEDLTNEAVQIPPPLQQRPKNLKRPQDWSAKEKLAAVLESAALSEEELGSFLRSRGLHEAQLHQWRELMLSGLTSVPVRQNKKAPEVLRIRELEKELDRKDKALAETAALLVLKKKVQSLWEAEAEDDDTSK
jgi:transposase